MLVRGTVLSVFLCASTAKRPVAPPHALERLQKCEASRCSELALTGSREASSKLTSSEAKAVMGALEKMDLPITSLDLRRNLLRDKGARAVAAMLAKNPRLGTIHLAGNAIGDDGARHIAEALRTNTHLHTLQLGNNVIQSEGVVELASLLQLNTPITSLGIGGNAVGDVGARALADALEVNTVLEKLQLWGTVSIAGEKGPEPTYITQAGVESLALALGNNTALTTLILGPNRLGGPGAAILLAQIPPRHAARSVAGFFAGLTLSSAAACRRTA